jgi:hypothetical protein
MAQKRGTTSKGTGSSSKTGGGKGRHNTQPTQKTPMQRVRVIGPTGKARMEWRPWEN